MSGFGGMVSFECRGGEAAALEVVSHTELFTLAESLGAVESLIEHPGRMTHASAAGSPLEVPARWCAVRWASRMRPTWSPT
nr:PLP-dependent transferase [Candidatus Microthrix sp.]